MGYKFLIIAVLAVSLSSCLRLDSNMFENIKLQEYELDDFTGPEISVPSIYDIEANKIHLIDIQSKGDNEVIPTEIKAIYIGDIANITTDTVIMYCHGNYGHMDYYWTRAKLLANIGHKNRFGVLMVDYRGYGMSEGESTEASLYIDVNSCLKWLKDQGLTDDRLIMYGFSMGTAPATELMAKPRDMQGHKLILEAPFASVDVMVQDGAGLALPSSFMTSLEIDNAEEIKAVEEDFLWIHGKSDAYLSITSHGELVFANHQGDEGTDKFAERVKGGEHSNVPIIMGLEVYINRLETFITQ